MSKLERHNVEWTSEQVRRFWDFHASNSALFTQYFTGMMGRSLLRYVSKRIRIGAALDIGCGGGQLLELLMQRGSNVYGSDQSPVSVEKVNAAFAGRSRFLGAAVGTKSLKNASVDTVFMVEVVEHLNEAELGQALDEAHRLLNPGGHLVLTTPNEENLDESKIMCPNCAAVFHQVQHVRSWSASDLAKRVSSHGFKTESSEGTALTKYSGLFDSVYRFLYFLRRKGARPNLIYIGSKI